MEESLQRHHNVVYIDLHLGYGSFTVGHPLAPLSLGFLLIPLVVQCLILT